jgi:hypothetical protein
MSGGDMLALMVGGPLHGQMLPLENPAQVRFTGKDRNGAVIEYNRRRPVLHNGLKLMLFVLGEPGVEQVEDALRLASLSNTGKMPVLDDSFVRGKGTDGAGE